MFLRISCKVWCFKSNVLIKVSSMTRIKSFRELFPSPSCKGVSARIPWLRHVRNNNLLCLWLISRMRTVRHFRRLCRDRCGNHMLYVHVEIQIMTGLADVSLESGASFFRNEQCTTKQTRKHKTVLWSNWEIVGRNHARTSQDEPLM